MSIQENKEFIRRFVKEVYNEHNLEILGEFADLDLPDISDEHLRQFFTAFPDSRTTIEDLIAEEDKVVARLYIGGTNTGPFAGQPPTGKKVQFRSIRVYRIADNKIVKSWAMQDRLGLMAQLGFVRSAGDVDWGAGEEE